MTVLWIVLGLLALLLLAGLACMAFAMVRLRAANPLNPKLLGKSSWKKHMQEVLDGVSWLDEHTTEFAQIESFDGLKLKARYCAHPNPRGTLLRMHGYRSEGRVDFSCAAKYFYDLGFNLLLADQRAHGMSEGQLITYGIKERRDCQKWAFYLAERFGTEQPLVLGGISMGAATVLMASNLALPENVRGIIADCGFTSPWDIIGHVMTERYHIPKFPLLHLTSLWARIFAGHSLRSCSAADCLKETKLPVLFLHGTGDRFVPSYMSEENFAACAGEKELVLVEGATHGLSFLVDPDRCKNATERFLNRYL